MPYSAKEIEAAFYDVGASCTRMAVGTKGEYVKVHGPSCDPNHPPYIEVLAESGDVCISNRIARVQELLRAEDRTDTGIGKASGDCDKAVLLAEIHRRFPDSAEDFVLAVVGAFTAGGVLW